MNMRNVIIIFVALLLVGGGYYAYQAKSTATKVDAPELVSAIKADIEDVVLAQGTLEPRDYVDVGAQVSGQLKRLYVDIGDSVKAGDLIADLDQQVYETIKKGDGARLNALQAQLQQQKAQTEYDRLQFERAQKLVKSGAVSQGDLEEKDKALKVAEATIKSLEAQAAEVQAALDKDMVNLSYTKIFAPMDGIISDRKAREGQTLNANQTTPTIVQIANLGVMTVRAEIAEADVMRLKPDMEVSFTTMGSDRKWQAKVRQILPTPEVVNDVVLYNALIDVENPDGALMNGMSVQVSFKVASAKDVLTIPPRALGARQPKQDNEKGKAYRVFVRTHQGMKERDVWVGLQTRSQAEITQGLSEGDEIIVTRTSTQGGRRTGMPPGMGARL